MPTVVTLIPRGECSEFGTRYSRSGQRTQKEPVQCQTAKIPNDTPQQCGCGSQALEHLGERRENHPDVCLGSGTLGLN